MALAAFKLEKCTGASPGTETNVNKNPTFQSADAVGSPSNNPVPIPELPTDPANYSYEVWLKLECTSPPNTEVSTFKVFGPDSQPDSPGPGKLTIYLGTTGTYVQPVDTASTKATTRADTNYYSAGTALAIGVQPGDNKINAIGEETDYMVFQLKVENGAATGNMESQNFTIRYEES